MSLMIEKPVSVSDIKAQQHQQQQQQQQTPLKVSIRWMIHKPNATFPGDLTSVLAIEQQCFNSPWSAETFHMLACNRDCIGMVAEVANGISDGTSNGGAKQIVGYLMIQYIGCEISLFNFAVDPACQRRGVGSQMIERLKKLVLISGGRRTRIVDIVRESNLPMQLMLRANGFKATEVLKGQFDDSEEDAFRMVWEA